MSLYSASAEKREMFCLFIRQEIREDSPKKKKHNNPSRIYKMLDNLPNQNHKKLVEINHSGKANKPCFGLFFKYYNTPKATSICGLCGASVNLLNTRSE